MLRIKGMIGDLPVDLTVELDAADWQQLAAHLPTVPSIAPAAAPNAPVTASDAQWQNALSLLRQAGEMEGPALLAAVSALTGGAAAGKRLLVRLRHCPQVHVEGGGETPLYRWVG
ncbi:hypothetical protein NVV93_17260 [Pseudomonas sp. LS44]|uniref:hypothetical protein n=1 Tax=Pseudomonas sp. LS44 TaxID=1357074 RepID=UPI00215B6AEF|nr:hypothetical protein [Pseudomonas sp. LS44]UVE17307.1 hypothetical protein NVV93_17260 [Pseudomonas sp. LS44]